MKSSDNTVDIDLVTQDNIIDLKIPANSDLPIGKQNQELTSDRTLDLKTFNLTFDIAQSIFRIESDQTQTERTYSTQDLTDFCRNTYDTNYSDELEEKLNFLRGHQVLFSSTEDPARLRFIDSITDKTNLGKGSVGWHWMNNGQTKYGSDLDFPNSDHIFAIEQTGRDILLPNINGSQEANLNKTDQGSFLFNADALSSRSLGGRELTYVDDDNRIRRVQNYGKRGYEVLNVPSDPTTNRWDIDCEISYNYLIIPTAAGDCNLNFIDLVDGDFGNIIIDLQALPENAKFNLYVPSSSPESFVVNGGNGILDPNDFVAGQIHTLTWTYNEYNVGARISRLYFTYGLNYTS